MSKIILVTGSSTGFGRKTVEQLLEAGHTVYASMRSPEDKNRIHAEALCLLGAKVVALDVTNTASVDAALADISAAEGRLDVVVNNAGIASAGVSEAFTPEQTATLFDVNVFGVQRVIRAVLPIFRARGDGLIINIGSILGRVTFPFFGLYGASKFALEALTDSYRYELSQLGIDAVVGAAQCVSHQYVCQRNSARRQCACRGIRRDRQNSGSDVCQLYGDVCC